MVVVFPVVAVLLVRSAEQVGVDVVSVVVGEVRVVGVVGGDKLVVGTVVVASCARVMGQGKNVAGALCGVV